MMKEIDSRDGLISALQQAAALEHAVVCRYLFAAFSLKTHADEGGVTVEQLEKVRSWHTTLFRVAREEMEHMGLVCNLLTAIGGAGHVRRPDWHRGRSGHPEPVELRRFDESTVAEFVAIERAHEIGLQVEPGPAASNYGMDGPLLQSETSEAVSQPADSEDDEPIGLLYARIRRGFEGVSSRNSLLFVGPEGAQVSNETLELPPGWFDFNLHQVTDLKTALRAIDQILEASHGPDRAPAPSHADAFEAMLADLHAIRASDSDFEPARPVAPDPSLLPAGEAEEGSTQIRHPLTRRAAGLFNQAYATMLLMLGRYYAPVGAVSRERPALQRCLFFPLMTTVIRPLGEMLTQMPVGDFEGGSFVRDAHVDRPVHDEDADARLADEKGGVAFGDADADDAVRAAERGRTAGATFDVDGSLVLPPDPLSAWTLLHERLVQMAESASQLDFDVRACRESWARQVEKRVAYLAENLSRLAYNFEREVNLRDAQTQHLFERVL